MTRNIVLKTLCVVAAIPYLLNGSILLRGGIEMLDTGAASSAFLLCLIAAILLAGGLASMSVILRGQTTQALPIAVHAVVAALFGYVSWTVFR
jgi:hypothetical protein